MAKAEPKTKPTAIDPVDFVDSVEHDTRRGDAKALLDLFGRVTGLEPRMWGPSIIGYGRYRYKYDSGRAGEFMMTGFSPRKTNLVLYIMPGYRDLQAELNMLGKHKIGKSCLYINKLADVDLEVLEKIISDGIAHLRATHQTYDV